MQAFGFLTQPPDSRGDGGGETAGEGEPGAMAAYRFGPTAISNSSTPSPFLGHTQTLPSLRLAIVLAVAGATAACGAINANVSLPAAAITPSVAGALPAMPSPCKGQRNRKKYAELALKLKTREADFCIPAFHGYGGALQYPAVERSVKLVLRSATANLYNDPQLGSGTAMFYLNLHFIAGTTFGTKFRSTGGLTGTKIVSGQPYTAYGIVTVGHLARMFTPCYAVATQGPEGGVLSNLGYLFSGVTITGDGYGVIEIYSGAQVSQEC